MLSLVQIYPKWLCIYGFVNKFLMGRIFEKLRNLCGSSNLSTDLVLWRIYMKKCISLVRIRLQTRNARNASIKIRKTLESTDLVKYSPYGECEIISLRKLWNIAPFGRNVKWNLPTLESANISHLRSKYFTAKLFHLPAGQISLKKALACASAFFCDVCPI